MIPQDINDRHSRSMIESTATPGVPGRAVVNPDGSNIASDVVSQLEVMNSLVPNKYDSLIITYTDSTKKTIDNVVFKLDGTTVQTITLAQATLTDTWARS